MNSLERLLEKGRKEGHEEGHKNGQADMLLGFLRDKFGELSEADAAKVREADAEALERYRKRFATADSVTAVLGPE